MDDKTLRRQRFENVASRRVQKILEQLDSLANCSNKGNYEYTEEDVRKIYSAIKEKVKSTEIMFDIQINRSEKNKFKL